MFTTMRRYVRAFALALKFTLRGEKPPLLHVRDQHPELAAWWDQTVSLVDAVERAARGLDAAALTLHVDRRDVSMATILATVKYHAQSEYPYLLVQNNPYTATTLQAINLNDRYLVTQLAAHVEMPVKSAVETLSAHLASLPDQS